jgi:glycosyltransferase involved in cell wall biosynthesis
VTDFMQVQPEPELETAPARSPAGVRLLSINTDLPMFPGGGGVEYLTLLQTARLADRVGLVSMAHTREHLAKAEVLRQNGIHVYLWQSPFADSTPSDTSHPPVLRRLHRLVLAAAEIAHAGLRRPRDTLVMDGAFRNLAPALVQALSASGWHAVSFVQSSAAMMREYMPRPWVSVLVLHDIRSVLYRRRAKAAVSRWERWRYLGQARRYEAFEREQCERFDLVVTVSDHDAAWVREHYRPRQVVAVPLPVDTSYFAAEPADREVRGRIVFSGLMSHPPNADAAVYFARKVLPLVRARVPDAEFWIVGREPTDAVKALNVLAGVRVTGGVPDIRPYLAGASVIVVPLTYGSGSRQKILEAWAVERCVVSTSIGAEGLHYEDGVHLAVADNADQMAATVVRALQDLEFRNTLRHAGRQIAVTLHDPVTSGTKYYGAVHATAADKAARSEPMRVALDMRWMVPGLAGGLEQLARAFLNELISVDRHNRYVAILPARSRHDFPLERTNTIRAVCLDSAAAYLERLFLAVSRSVHARLHLDDWQSPEVLQLRLLRSLDAEIAYSFPGYIHPDLWPLRQVLVVPDIQHEYFPEFFSEQAVAERRRLFGDSIRRADHICAISEFTRQSLIERLGTAPERITTVHLAADAIFSADPCLHDRATLEKHALQPGRYLFFPAHTWHHKNHRAALAALRILRDKYSLSLELVCTGGPREAQPALDRQIEAEQLPVRFLGYCPRTELPALYRHAACLVFPSLFEGFGMPVLEAMACGCPVACSNTTSLPEIAGDSAVLIDPLDHEGLADALAGLLRSPDLRGELAARGLRQAARFSWRRHTLETIGVLHRVHQALRNV